MYIDIKSFNIKNINFLLSLLSLILIITPSIFAIMITDDWLFEFYLKEKTPLEFAKDMYLFWDGRAANPLFVFYLFLVKILSTKIHIFLLVVIFLLSLYIYFSTFFPIAKLNLDRINYIILFVLFVLTFYYGANKTIGMVVYYQTGGIYTFYLLLGLIWFKWYKNIKKFKFSTLLFFLLFSILLGLSTPNLTFPLLFIIIIDILIKKFNNNIQTSVKILIIIALLIGLAIILTAPGNVNRIGQHNIKSLYNFIRTIILGITAAPFKFLELSKNYILAVFIFSIFLYLFGIRIKFTKNQFTEIIIWYLIAFSSIIPFLLVTYLVKPSTILYFLIFITYPLTKTYLILLEQFFKTSLREFNNDIIHFLIFFVLVVNVLIFNYINYQMFNIHATFKKNEIDIIKAKKLGKTKVYIRPFTNIPMILYIKEGGQITDDPNSYINQNYQRYYGIDTILPLKEYNNF